MDENHTAKRNQLEAELRAVQSALTLYRAPVFAFSAEIQHWLRAQPIAATIPIGKQTGIPTRVRLDLAALQRHRELQVRMRK
jgi:hypothetical protein